MATAAGRHDEALAACTRGLTHASGAIGRTSLLVTEARAWIGKGDAAKAHRVLEEALRSARAIGNQRLRERNVQRISAMIASP